MTFKNKKFTINKYKILSIILVLCLILTAFSSYVNYSHKNLKIMLSSMFSIKMMKCCGLGVLLLML